MARGTDLTPAEFNVLKALWQLGKGSVAEVRTELAARGSDLAYTTVMTLLGRLAQKGAVAVDRTREPFLYKAAQRRESVLRDRLRDFVREVFDGQADALVMRLVEDESLSLTELESIQKRVETAERDPEPAPTAAATAKKDRR
jgi:BlaI family transcriptional regulator, penicillinase repressor